MSTTDIDYYALNISDDEFASFSDLVVRETGILLRPAKRELLMNRLRGILRSRGFTSYGEYYRWLLRHPHRQQLMELIESITTTKTEFYRYRPQIDWLRTHAVPDAVRALAQDPTKRYRVWSAGCSTGEEPYTLALILIDGLPALDCDRASVLASDINPRVLAAARAGRFRLDRMRQVPDALVEQHFRLDEDEYVAGPRIRRLLSFSEVNLVDDSTWPREVFDVIFCRNVLIYMPDEVKRTILTRFHDYLTPGGLLFVGHSETLHGVTAPYEYLAPSIYRKEPS